MGSQNREGGHGVDGYRRRKFCCKALSKEGNPALGFAARGEEFGHIFLIGLGHEERRRIEGTPPIDTSINLMIEKLLDVVDGEKVFTVHGNDDGVPNLRDKYLDWFSEY